MGIRLQKLLGYGLADIQLDENNTMIDPRINLAAFSDYGAESIQRKSMVGYRKWILENEPQTPLDEEAELSYDDIRYLSRSAADEDLAPQKATDFIHLLSEGQLLPGSKGILLCQPYLTSKEWTRSDDIFDFVENQKDNADTKDYTDAPKVKLLPYGIWPYDGQYVDVLTGKILTSRQWRVIRTAKENKAENSFLTKVLDELGYESVEEAHQRVVPKVPAELHSLLNWANIFTNTGFIRNLKPMVVTFWQ